MRGTYSFLHKQDHIYGAYSTVSFSSLGSNSVSVLRDL